MDTAEAHRRSSLASRAAGSQYAGHRADEACPARAVRNIVVTDAAQAALPTVSMSRTDLTATSEGMVVTDAAQAALPTVSMSRTDLTATSEGNADMLFLFEVFDIFWSVPQLQRLKDLKVTNISDLCNLSPENASLLVSMHNFPQHFLAVLWFLDHKRYWMPRDNLSMILADRRTEVSFV